MRCAGYAVRQVVGSATRSASDLIAAGEDLLTHGGLPSDEQEVHTDLYQSDKLHPNAAGHRRWARCLEEAIEACPADCIHLVSRTQLAALEAQRHNGTVARLPEWKDQITATNKRMGTTGSNDPTIRRQREESRRAAEL